MKKALSLISIALVLLSFKTIAASATIGPCQESGCVKYFKKYKKYANIGYADAMVTLAEMYYYGYGTDRNMKKALKQFKSAAKYGSIKGQFKTAMIYFNNEELRDLDKGIKYLKKAARNNNIDSSFLLGIMYFDADFYQQDFEEADEWLTKAYRKKYDKMPAYIELMKESGNFTEANFPNLMAAIEDDPIVLTKAVQVEDKPSKPVQTKSKELAQASDKTQQAPSKRDIEVITVYNDLPQILDAQLISFRYNKPEKGAQNTGSKIIGKTCDKIMSCAPTSTEDFKRGVRLVLGDHAVAAFSESFRGYSGF